MLVSGSQNGREVQQQCPVGGEAGHGGGAGLQVTSAFIPSTPDLLLLLSNTGGYCVVFAVPNMVLVFYFNFIGNSLKK